MNYVCTLIAVTDMERSKKFYQDVLGLEVVADFGANVTLSGGIALQTIETWKTFIQKSPQEIVQKNNACELYFEDDDIDGFSAKLNRLGNIKLIHPLLEHPWGQRVVRFYDCDGHIIEVAEPIDQVVHRFLKQGLSPEETAARMDVPIDFVHSCCS